MKNLSGFTVVELIVVIIVIGILVVIGGFAWSSWNSSVIRSDLEAELSSVAIAMDQHRNFNDVYPTSLPPNYRSGSNVTVTYRSGDANSYCVEAFSTTNTAIRYKTNTGAISAGGC